MDQLKVTNVKFRWRRKEQSHKVIANCTITINNVIKIEDTKFLYDEEKDEYGLQFPAKKDKDGEFYRIVKISKFAKEPIVKAVTEQYEYLRNQGLWVENDK